MAHVMLERSFDAPLTETLLGELTGRLAPCLDRNGVRWIRSHLSLDGRRLICEFEAPDAGAVRDALRQGRIEHDRVWSSRTLEPAHPTPGHAP